MVRIQVKKPAEYEYEEIGELDFTTRIPTPKGAKCSYCITAIDEGNCTIGVKKDMKLMYFHLQGCLGQEHLFEEDNEHP